LTSTNCVTLCRFIARHFCCCCRRCRCCRWQQHLLLLLLLWVAVITVT